MQSTMDRAKNTAGGLVARKRESSPWDINTDKAVAAATKRRDELRERVDKLQSALDSAEAAAAQRRSEAVAAVADGASVDIDPDNPEQQRIERKLSIARDALAVSEQRLSAARSEAADKLKGEYARHRAKLCNELADAADAFLAAHEALKAADAEAAHLVNPKRGAYLNFHIGDDAEQNLAKYARDARRAFRG